MAWTTWGSRNQSVFRGEEVTVSQASDRVRICACSRKQQKVEAWIPPLGDDLKFNVDGSALGKPGPVGIGGVLRDSNGKVLCLFSFSIGLNDSNEVEILAIHKACDLCISNPLLRGRNIEIISDSKTAVSWIKNDGVGNLKHVKEIYDIRSNMDIFGGMVISHHSRASNFFADNLAEIGSCMRGIS
ncbi:hypothetical protein Dsin_006775 [Dipteronia sinensis]|uniref:RNase H type-1 domain-containing protein n=1 Tax=Dipteronia sinensis TaxID=43782 RepID=A0AAE0EFW6_9ROSI|nr:hypothetical protein Dsin_006775 [Dipteronia sinensis]